MKNTYTYKATLLIALGLAGVSAAHAGSTDLLLGFNDAAGPTAAQNDYVIDLGLSGSQLLANAAANNGSYDLSSTFNVNTFNTAFVADNNALNSVTAGVVGASGSSPEFLFQTAPVGTTPGSITYGEYTAAFAAAGAPIIGEYSSGTAGGWSSDVAVSPTSPGSNENTTGQNVAGQTGTNPLGQLSSGVLDLTLWGNTLTKSGLQHTVQGWVDEGTIDINLNTDTVSFTAVAVPEPRTYGFVAGAGLLFVALRRQSGTTKL
jgi:hypothetical protein